MRFWNGMTKKNVLQSTDKIMIGDDITGETMYSTLAELIFLSNQTIKPLTVTAFTDLDRIDLADGIYNVDGSSTGILFVAKSYIENVLDSVLQVYIDSGFIKVRRISIVTPQTYAEWVVKSVSITERAKIGYGEVFGYALSDQTSNITAEVKISETIGREFNLDYVYLSLAEAATGGIFTVNIKKNGTTIFTTKITIDASETSNITASTPYVLITTPTVFNTGNILSISVDAVGGTATGKGAIIRGYGYLI